MYPSLNNIYSYFIDISTLILKLKIPLLWFTLNGLEIEQHYFKTVEKKSAINLFGEIRTLVLREPTDKVNKSKQKQAIILNIIHSLDVNYLMKVII